MTATALHPCKELILTLHVQQLEDSEELVADKNGSI